MRIPPKTALQKYEELSPEQRIGALAWKQGWCFKLIHPPWGNEDIINTRQPIPGVKYHTGPDSAYLSIVRMGGKVPENIRRDMGIMDINITTASGVSDPVIRYKVDVAQATRKTGVVTEEEAKPFIMPQRVPSVESKNKKGGRKQSSDWLLRV